MERKNNLFSIGDVIKNVEILAVDGYGEGIAKVKDTTVFVKGNVKKREICKIRINAIHRTYVMADKK